MKILYHANCADGFCAAWLFHLAYPDAEFIPVQYGSPPPDVKGDGVFILDFSYKRPVMEQLIADTEGELTVLDHHTTAEEELKGLEDYCLFDMTKSGGRLAWEYLWDNNLLPVAFSHRPYSRLQTPWQVDYTEDRDLWRHALPLTKEINASLQSYPYSFAQWAAWAHWEYRDYTPKSRLCEFSVEGEAILRYQSQVIAQHVERAVEIELSGFKVLSLNATSLADEIGQELCKDRPFSATYYFRADGKKIWSLRSREQGVDVSVIAKAHGGGGHKHAAGFEEEP